MKKKYLLLNCIVPLFLGGILYYLYSPEVYFVKGLDYIIGMQRQTITRQEMTPVMRVIRYWGADMLWSYALLFSLHFITDNKTVSTEKLFCIAALFTCATEVAQCIPGSSGTYDVCDIVVEWTALVIAVIIIKYYDLRRRKKDEST